MGEFFLTQSKALGRVIRTQPCIRYTSPAYLAEVDYVNTVKEIYVSEGYMTKLEDFELLIRLSNTKLEVK